MRVRSFAGRSAAAVWLLAAACTSPGGTLGPVPTSQGTKVPATLSLPPPGTGKESADAVRLRLCRRPPAPSESPATPGPAPAVISQTEREVEAVRGLRYKHPVAVDAVTHAQLVKGLDQSFNHSFPAELLGRRSRVWTTIGVVPPGTELRQAIHRFLSSQVIGYYDPDSGQLVFIGTNHPSGPERLTLAHELTHADDDQHFDLSRLDAVENHCDDESLMAALGAVEGSAVFFSFQAARRFFSEADKQAILHEKAPPPKGVPAFVQSLELWPYFDGPRFIQTLLERGGRAEVDRALLHFPVSTEQVIHPERYPSDVPQTVQVPNFRPALGAGWRDLDVMGIGEEWLKAMLTLRLDPGTAAQAAAGWGGGQYRAWTDGKHVAVAMLTTWDTAGDANEFTDAVGQWLGSSQAAKVFAAGDRKVLVLFASDQQTLSTLERAT